MLIEWAACALTAINGQITTFGSSDRNNFWAMLLNVYG
jgi:hypothetical protein